MEPRWAQAFLGRIGEALGAIRESLVLLHAQLPDPSEAMVEDVTPRQIGPELKSLLDRPVTDDLEPAIDKLIRASEVTPAELRDEWFQRHFAGIRPSSNSATSCGVFHNGAPWDRVCQVHNPVPFRAERTESPFRDTDGPPGGPRPMAGTFSRLLYHVVFSNKNRVTLIDPSLRAATFKQDLI